MQASSLPRFSLSLFAFFAFSSLYLVIPVFQFRMTLTTCLLFAFHQENDLNFSLCIFFSFHIFSGDHEILENFMNSLPQCIISSRSSSSTDQPVLFHFKRVKKCCVFHVSLRIQFPLTLSFLREKRATYCEKSVFCAKLFSLLPFSTPVIFHV